MYREKSPEEIVATLGEQAEDAERSLDLPAEYWDKAERLLRWVDVDEETYHSFRQNFDSEQVKTKIDAVYEQADTAREYLEEGDAEGLRGYLEEVAEIEREMYREEFELADFSDIELEEDNRLDSSGGADVYDLDDSGKVLALRGSKADNLWDLRPAFRRYIRHSQVPEDVNFARVEELGFKDGRMAELMEKAPGTEVHKEEENYERWSEMNEKMAEAPVEAFEEFVEATRILPFYNLSIDGSKSDNFFYDPENQQFTHIDNDAKRFRQHRPFHESLITPVAAARHPRRFDESKVTQEDVENTKAIMDKFKQAGDPESDEDIQTALNILKDLSPEVDFERESPTFDVEVDYDSADIDIDNSVGY